MLSVGDGIAIYWNGEEGCRNSVSHSSGHHNNW